jgi:hypothetical protein
VKLPCIVYTGQPVPNGFTARVILVRDEESGTTRAVVEKQSRDRLDELRWVDADERSAAKAIEAALVDMALTIDEQNGSGEID